MFEEIERESSQNNYNNYNNAGNNGKLFEIDGITNKDIGKKIKSFARFFLKFTIFLYIVSAVIFFFVCMSSDYPEETIWIFFGYAIGLCIAFVFSYYGFLLVAGFGALIEDVNSIKTLSTRGDSKVSQKEKYEDLPKL